MPMKKYDKRIIDITLKFVLDCFPKRKLLCRVRELTYPEFPFENEDKGDGLIGMHQTKEVKV